MILLDTDHLSIHAFAERAQHLSLASKIRQASEEVGTTIVCVTEELSGWVVAINKRSDVSDQVPLYDRLQKLWFHLRDWTIERFDERAADRFKALRKQKIRIGSQDLKIASIALVNDALLLSANLR